MQFGQSSPFQFCVKVFANQCRLLFCSLVFANHGVSSHSSSHISAIVRFNAHAVVREG